MQHHRVCNIVVIKSLAVVVAALVVVGYLAASRGSATATRKLMVGFVTYSGVVPSKLTLDGQMLLGFLRAEKELAIQGRVVLVSPNGDPADALSSLGAQRYDLVVVALPRADVVYTVARKFPGVRFFVIDAPVHGPKRPAQNVQGSIYRASEAAYLAGYLAALTEVQSPGKHVISAVGGIAYEGVNRWLVGYRAGARKADPTIAVRIDFSRNFTNPAKCRRVALNQIAEGSGVVFNVAGDCGFGTLAAAKDEGVWGIGVDVDQSFLGPHVLTSAVLKLDQGVFTIVKQFVAGRLAKDKPTYFGLSNNGVGLGRISPKVQPGLLRRVESVRRAIITGKIHVPGP